MSHKTRARDERAGPPYRVELPMLLDDLNLSVYAFRLYVHLKRVAQDEGSCWQSARTLATACNMSAGAVSKAKDELAHCGLIVRHIKMMRGGIGDDITIVDIWTRNFHHYAPQSDAAKESDHHAITSPPEVITTRSLSESDHHTITSPESDHQVIAETIKRSPGDPKKDQYHIESDSNTPPPTAREPSNAVGGDDYYRELRRRKVGPVMAHKIADMGGDSARVLALIDNRPHADDPNSLGRLINDIIDGVALDYAERAVAAPLTATRANRPESTVAPSAMLQHIREQRHDTS